MKRSMVALVLGVLAVGLSCSAAVARTADGTVKPLDRDPDPAAVRDSMGQGEGVVTRDGKFAGFKCGSTVVLPADVTATAVCAPDGSGKVVGYMTFGDVGFVDKSTGRDRKALGTLVRCHAEIQEYMVSGSVPFTKQCSSALKAQGVEVRHIPRGSPEYAARLAAYSECMRQSSGPGGDLAACPSP